jgi:pimeloyl-ACP methyl ester carboxylesterase
VPDSYGVPTLVELPTGQTLGIDRHGSAATTIVLLHGISGSRLSFRSVVPHLMTRVERGAAQLVNVDLRGHGTSTRATRDEYDAVGYAADVAALIETIAAAPATVVGHSLGGVVASALAVTRPELVHAVLLEDPPSFEGDEQRRATSPAASLFPALIAAVRALQTRGAGPEEYRALAAPGLSPGEVEARALSLHQWDPETMAAALEGVMWRGFDPLAVLPCPVTVLRADPAVGAVFSPQDAARFAAANPAARVVEVRGAGHTIHAEATLDTFLAHLDEFLDTM